MNTFEKKLYQRSEFKCELCQSTHDLFVYQLDPKNKNDNKEEYAVLICQKCHNQISLQTPYQSNHWRCLNDSIWSQTPAVQILSWRILHRIKEFGWSQDLIDMMYLDQEMFLWANALGDADQDNKIQHKDCNGNILKNGDSVVLIKDLVVKGANFTAKRGTAVHRISLVSDNDQHIEGKIEGQHIVILTKYIKKTKES